MHCPTADEECLPNRRRCGKSPQCISVLAFCDGVNDCKNHYDENPERCGKTFVLGNTVWEHFTMTRDRRLSYTVLAGYPASLETLSPGLSPPPSLVPLSPLSYSSLPSTLPPSDYPASLKITPFPRYFLNLEA